MVMSAAKLSASSLCFPRTPKPQRGKYLHGSFSADLEEMFSFTAQELEEVSASVPWALQASKRSHFQSERDSGGAFVRISHPKLAE